MPDPNMTSPIIAKNGDSESSLPALSFGRQVLLDFLWKVLLV